MFKIYVLTCMVQSVKGSISDLIELLNPIFRYFYEVAQSSPACSPLESFCRSVDRFCWPPKKPRCIYPTSHITDERDVVKRLTWIPFLKKWVRPIFLAPKNTPSNSVYSSTIVIDAPRKFPYSKKTYSTVYPRVPHFYQYLIFVNKWGITLSLQFNVHHL